MKLIDILTKKSPNKVFFSSIVGLLAGFAYSLLIPLTLMSLMEGINIVDGKVTTSTFTFLSLEVTTPKIALAFLLLCLFIIISRSTSQVLMMKVSIDSVTDLRMDLYKRISNLPIQEMERIGFSRLLAVLTTDAPAVIHGATLIPEVAISSVTVIALLGYVFYQSPEVFFFTMAALVFGIITYQVPITLGNRFFSRSRNIFDRLHEAMRGLIFGAKELKLNQERRESFFLEELNHNEITYRGEVQKGSAILIVAASYGGLLSFVAMGVAVFLLRGIYNISVETLMGTVMAMLYITGPMAEILDSISGLQRAKVSLNKINDTFEDLPVEETNEAIGNNSEWERLRFKDLSYVYKSDDESRHFFLGPLDLEIHRGEITFLTGGNGSGKSTLAKVVSQHYLPKEGEILFDDTVINNENRNSYRQTVSAIFTDFYLFSKLLGMPGEEIDRLGAKYLKKLRLDEKVQIKDGMFSTTSLSDGQRKRLALLVAYLENREMCVFDEWAADQDPIFKDVFYKEILPELKAQNKAIVVVSHDDRYFDVADQLVIMEEGKIVNIKRTKKKPVRTA